MRDQARIDKVLNLSRRPCGHRQRHVGFAWFERAAKGQGGTCHGRGRQAHRALCLKDKPCAVVDDGLGHRSRRALRPDRIEAKAVHAVPDAVAHRRAHLERVADAVAHDGGDAMGPVSFRVSFARKALERRQIAALKLPIRGIVVIKARLIHKPISRVVRGHFRRHHAVALLGARAVVRGVLGAHVEGLFGVFRDGLGDRLRADPVVFDLRVGVRRLAGHHERLSGQVRLGLFILDEDFGRAFQKACLAHPKMRLVGVLRPLTETIECRDSEPLLAGRVDGNGLSRDKRIDKGAVQPRFLGATVQ